MADVPELHLVQNRCGGMSLNKKGMGGAIWTNLDVTSVIEQNESCPVDEHLAYKMEKKAILKKWSAEETKPILAIYNEEASAEPSTFLNGNRTKRYPELPKHRRDKISSKHLTINLNLIDIKMKHF
ncbi:hypothetical protein T06_11225 [Trichinella sp. T6]|nr:hypothetical protein T06_11225 [Trichinella sp. T6]